MHPGSGCVLCSCASIGAGVLWRRTCTGRCFPSVTLTARGPRFYGGKTGMAQSTIVGQGEEAVSSGNPQPESRTTSKRPRAPKKGLAVERRYTRPGRDPLEEMVWERRQSVITNPDGSVVFKMEGAEVPADWSQLATDIVVSKYFRKAGLYGDKTQGETSVRQVVHRIAHSIRIAGESFGGYFASAEDAETFEHEQVWLMANQYGAFNSPVWFNCGLWHEYRIEGSGGNWTWDP